MLRRRVIPCLDVRGGRLVKGVNFESLRDCGDPVDAADALRRAGRRRDRVAQHRGRRRGLAALLAAVERAAETVDVPLCVGGGVYATEQARELLLAGADKISFNTAPLDRPGARRRSWPTASAASAWWSRSTPPGERRLGGVRERRPPADRPRRRQVGRARRPSWARASCWSPASTATAPRAGTTSTCCARSATRGPRAGDRLRRRRRRRATWRRRCEAGASARAGGVDLPRRDASRSPR